MSVLMSVLNVLFWVGNCQSCLRNMCRIMYFQCGVGAHQQRLKLSDGRVLQLEGSDAESLVSWLTVDWSRTAMVNQTWHDQTDIVKGQRDWQSRLGEIAKQWCLIAPHMLSHFPRLSITICFGDVLGCYVNNAMWPCWLWRHDFAGISHTYCPQPEMLRRT
jgi:hypothetical protein